MHQARYSSIDDYHRPPFHGRLGILYGSPRTGYGSDPCRQRHPGTAMGHNSTDTSDLWNGSPLFPYQTLTLHASPPHPILFTLPDLNAARPPTASLPSTYPLPHLLFLRFNLFFTSPVSFSPHSLHYPLLLLFLSSYLHTTLLSNHIFSLLLPSLQSQ